MFTEHICVQFLIIFHRIIHLHQCHLNNRKCSCTEYFSVYKYGHKKSDCQDRRELIIFELRSFILFYNCNNELLPSRDDEFPLKYKHFSSKA